MPFVFFNDGLAAGKAIESSTDAAVMKAEALSREPWHVGPCLASLNSSLDGSPVRQNAWSGEVPHDLFVMTGAVKAGTPAFFRAGALFGTFASSPCF